MLGVHNLLPAYGQYHLRGHSSSGNWLCYVAQPCQLKLLHFLASGNIDQNLCITLQKQPVKAVKLITGPDDVCYIAVLYITRAVFYRKDEVLGNDFRLELDCNIVNFKKGFSACDASTAHNSWFLLANCEGILTTVAVPNTSQRKSVKIDIVSPIISLSIIEDKVFAGCEDGTISLLQIQTGKHIFSYDTNSKLPVLQLKAYSLNKVMAATCDGSIHVVGLEMDSRSITAHYGAIYLLHIDHQNILYSFGDDAILRSFTISKDGLLTAASSTAYSKKANMIFSVCGRTFLTFYEQNGATLIS